MNILHYILAWKEFKYSLHRFIVCTSQPFLGRTIIGSLKTEVIGNWLVLFCVDIYRHFIYLTEAAILAHEKKDAHSKFCYPVVKTQVRNKIWSFFFFFFKKGAQVAAHFSNALGRPLNHSVDQRHRKLPDCKEHS